MQREVQEETGIVVTVGRLAGVYSNVKSHIVMFDFLCEYVSGEPTPSAESLSVEWVEREQVSPRIIRPVIRDRMRDMLEFDGNVIYRATLLTPTKSIPSTQFTRRERFEAALNDQAFNFDCAAINGLNVDIEAIKEAHADKWISLGSFKQEWCGAHHPQIIVTACMSNWASLPSARMALPRERNGRPKAVMIL